MIVRTRAAAAVLAALLPMLGGCGLGPQATGDVDAVADPDDGGGEAGAGGLVDWASGQLRGGGDTSRLVPAQVMDEDGFGQPMVAANLLVPAGWRAAGGIGWNDAADCYSNQMRLAWAAVSPDSASVIEILPSYVWQVQGTEVPLDPCPVAPYRSVREFLEAVATQARPGARVLDYSEWPELAQKTRQQAQKYGKPVPKGFERDYQAGRMLIGYQAEGVEMREVIAAAVGFSRVAASGNTVASASRVAAYRAPEGALDLDLLDRVVDSIEEDPQWFAAAIERVQGNVDRFYSAQLKQIEAWHARRMAEINARGAAARAAVWAQATREIAAIRAQTHADTMSTSDRIHARTIDGIYERNAYTGIHGGTVYSSIHGGTRVFQDNSDPGQVFSTDDPYVDPANATELQPVR